MSFLQCSRAKKIPPDYISIVCDFPINSQIQNFNKESNKLLFVLGLDLVFLRFFFFYSFFF